MESIWILALGIVVSAIAAYFVWRRPKLVEVTRYVDSHGMSDQEAGAFTAQPDDAKVTITLANNEVIETTAGEVKKRFRKAEPGGKPHWVYRESTNLDALILFVAGTAISVVLFFLS